MKVYLINAETKEIIQTFENVITWDKNFVEYTNNNLRTKMYCGENEYFTDKEVQDDK